MTFVHPWLLLGVAAAFIPLLIHLFDRRRPRPQPFPPLSFVLRSQRRTASRLRLRRLILYALRTFLFVAFPVALARPEWRRQDIAPTIARGPAATAVLLDASLSMRYRDGEPLFERGRNEARAVLTTLQASEAAALLICGLLPPSRRAPTLDRRALLAELDGAAPSFAAVDMTRCLEAAARSLEESPLPKKRIVVISDFTARAFPAGAVLPTVIGPDNKPVRPEVVLRDVVPGKTTLPNHALAGLKIQPAPHAGPRAFQLTFSVKNYGPTPLHDLNVQLKAGDAVVARGFVEVPPGGTVEKVFTHRFEVAGLVQGEVSLDPDNLPEDDHQALGKPRRAEGAPGERRTERAPASRRGLFRRSGAARVELDGAAHRAGRGGRLARGLQPLCAGAALERRGPPAGGGFAATAFRRGGRRTVLGDGRSGATRPLRHAGERS